MAVVCFLEGTLGAWFKGRPKGNRHIWGSSYLGTCVRAHTQTGRFPALKQHDCLHDIGMAGHGSSCAARGWWSLSKLAQLNPDT